MCRLGRGISWRETMSTINDPLNIRQILQKNLDIPDYQRPYRWHFKHVLDLIMDVEREIADDSTHKDGYRYRIGSVILHDQDDRSNVVDGQQRLLTIGLILSVLKPEELEGFPLFKKEFTDVTTLENLSYNRERIDHYFQGCPDDRKAGFVSFLLDGCEMVIIMADTLAEAFQLFDSQNTKGKPLDPADLLKAYHLRAMSDEHEKRMCVYRWEDAIDRKVLYPVLSDIIYRCRRWMKRDYQAYDFSNRVIDEFKGANINVLSDGGQSLPYQRRLFVTSLIDAFSIDEPITNGKRFFDYIDHYVAVCDKLFPAIGDFKVNQGETCLPGDNPDQDRVRRNCFYSPKMYRMGDKRLRNAFYCMLVAYFDKFGEAKYEEFFGIAFQYVYQLRLELKQISKESIRQYVLEGKDPQGKTGQQIRNPFEWISDSYEAYPMKLRTALRRGDSVSVDKLNNKVR